MTDTSPTMTELTMETRIEAAPDAVWRALTTGIGDWWPDEFHAGGAPGKRRFELEAEPGGRMQETWDGGGGVLWGNVVCADPGKRLQVAGLVFPNWGGPTQWFGTWDLSVHGDATLLRFSEHAIGRAGDGYAAEKEKGWRFLWDVMKANVEGRPPPAWED